MDRSSYDRFSNHEDIDISNEPEYEEGYKAREAGKPLAACRYEYMSPAAQRWIAGWADADMGISSDNEGENHEDVTH